MLKLAGYADRMSARPGETFEFKISNATGAPVKASLVRVICADPNPAGPGIVTEPVAATIEQLAAPKSEPVERGSYGIVEGARVLAGLTSCTLAVTVMPTRLGADRSLMSCLDSGRNLGIGLAIDGKGRPMATLGDGQGFVRLESPAVLQEGRWYRLWVSRDCAAGTLELGCQPLEGGKPVGKATVASRKIEGAAALGVERLLLGATAPGAGDPFRFSGRIEAPLVLDRAAGGADIEAVLAGTGRGVVGHWDLAQEISSNRIVDVGPNGLHGRLVNQPTRALIGSTWTGREMCWRHAPDEYAAVHLHDDDIDDCRWPTTHRWRIPDGFKSGVYALMLEAGAERENIPVFVVPPKGKRTARIALLVSTFTYVVYHNHARPEWQLDEVWRKAWIDQAAEWGAYPHNPGQHGEYGLSTYNVHTDGSGISTASWHRPMLNVRVGYITYPYPDIRASGLRHFPADSHLTTWLEKKGFAFDVITDWELHHEGHELLKDYAVVMTGTHPEYHTREMLDALTAYRDGGGRFCYLGGNGFYWKIALSKEKPGLIEIRRAEGGIRAWAAEVGEYYNQLDGEYGGLWRRNGRPPQKLAGVGFTAQGNFVGSYYRILEEGRDPRTAWMLEGITEETIGSYGLSGHGAAGFELDRSDKRLGTPLNAVVVARSERHPPEAPWVLVPEEHLTHIVTLPGVPARELIHADLTFFETAGGKGAVFSTGSITFCGSLLHDGAQNGVSRLLQNVLDRFLDPRPFATSSAG